MIHTEDYISSIKTRFPELGELSPWEIVENLDHILLRELKTLGADYRIENNIAIHKTAVVEKGVILKGTVIISENCFVGAHAYMRDAVYLGKQVSVGPGCEIKRSMLFDQSGIAHFNFIGNSILGEHTNFEAGAICANHYNEREDKRIFVKYQQQIIDTNSTKFGSLVGDHSKIGANAVLSPGTILEKNSIVKRLELIEQIP